MCGLMTLRTDVVRSAPSSWTGMRDIPWKRGRVYEHRGLQGPGHFAWHPGMAPAAGG